MYETNHSFIINVLIFFLFYIGRWVEGNWKKDGKLSYIIRDVFTYGIIAALMIYSQTIGIFNLDSIWGNWPIVVSVILLKLPASNMGYGYGFKKDFIYLGTVNYFDKKLTSLTKGSRLKIFALYFLMIALGLVNWGDVILYDF